MGKADDSFARLLLADPDASAAEHALVGVIDEQRTGGVYRQFGQNFPEPFCLQLSPEMLGYFLKLTGTAFETMGTVNRVSGQEKFQRGAG